MNTIFVKLTNECRYIFCVKNKEFLAKNWQNKEPIKEL